MGNCAPIKWACSSFYIPVSSQPRLRPDSTRWCQVGTTQLDTVPTQRPASPPSPCLPPEGDRPVPWLSPPATCSTTRNPSLARAWGQGQGQGAWSLSETITLWARTSWPLEGQPRLWWAQWGEVLWGLQCRWQVDHNWGKTNTSSSTQWPPGHSTDRRVRYKRREGKKESHEMTIYCKL